MVSFVDTEIEVSYHRAVGGQIKSRSAFVRSVVWPKGRTEVGIIKRWIAQVDQRTAGSLDKVE